MCKYRRQRHNILRLDGAGFLRHLVNKANSYLSVPAPARSCGSGLLEVKGRICPRASNQSEQARGPTTPCTMRRRVGRRFSATSFERGDFDGIQDRTSRQRMPASGRKLSLHIDGAFHCHQTPESHKDCSRQLFHSFWIVPHGMCYESNYQWAKAVTALWVPFLQG